MRKAGMKFKCCSTLIQSKEGRALSIQGSLTNVERVLFSFSLLMVFKNLIISIPRTRTPDIW